MVEHGEEPAGRLPPGARDLDTKLAAALERVGQALRTELRQRAREHGLTPTQAQVLLRLAHERRERRRVGTLAADLDLSAPTLSDAVAVLLRKGLVQRAPDPADARARTLRLTQRGELAARRLEDWDERIQQQLAELSRTGKEETLLLLLDLIARLYRDGVVSVARTCVTCRHLRVTRDAEGGARRHCALLDMPLGDGDLRLDCPEHEPATA